jgi:glycosyl transferase family 25
MQGMMSELFSVQALALAEQMASMGDLSGALERCREVLAVEPNNAEAQKLSASIQLRSGALAAYRINLKKRTDRAEQCRGNEAAFGYPEGFISLKKAVEEPDYGAVGCGKSHIEGLTEFFLHGNSPYCMMLEDDFDFLRPAHELVETLGAIERSGVEWDVLLLCGTRVIPFEQPAAAPFLLRVLESQTTAGYIVHRRYVHKLLGCFTEAVAQLERFRAIEDRNFIGSRFAIDIAWKNLQHTDRWYVVNPTFGHQRAGFSDIEGKVNDYAYLTFYKWP